MDQSVLHIINAMSGQLGQQALDQAPQLFFQLAAQPGLSQCLVSLLSQPTNNPTIRLYTSVLLKQLISDNWQHEEEAIDEHEAEALVQAHFSPEHFAQAQKIQQLRQLQSELSIEDKTFLKSTLPSLLADPTVTLRSNIAFSIALIGEHDYPDKWPELLSGLLGAAQSNDANLVQGGLLCFNILLDKVIDTSMKNVALDLFNTIVHLLQQPTTAPAIRIQALDLYSAFIQSFTFVEQPSEKGFEKKFEKYLKPSLQHLLPLCLNMIDAPISTPESCQFETRGCAMKVITRLVSYFPVTLKSAIDAQHLLLDRVAMGFNSGLKLYIDYLALPTNAMNIDPRIVEGLAFFINCIVSFVDIMADSTKHFPKFIMGKLDKFLPSFCYAVVLTHRDVESYQDDLNQFTVDESTINYDKDSGEEVSLMSSNDAEKTSMVRHEAIRFINIALNKWSKSAPLLVTSLAQEMWARGDQMKIEFEQQLQINASVAFECNVAQHWWKFHEAALICLGRILSSEKGYELATVQNTFPIPTIISLIQQFAGTTTFPENREAEVYLQCRAMWLVAHVIRVLTSQMTSQLHKTKEYEKANITQQLLYQCLNLLPQGLTTTPLPTQISTAHSISQCYQSFIAIGHSVLMYQCQQLDAKFYLDHPQFKADYDRCMATGQEIPLQQQFVNSIPITFTSGFASHFPIFLISFCRLSSQLEDDGLIAVIDCVRWIFEFFQQWNELIRQLQQSHPYLQFQQPSPAGSNQTQISFVSQLIPHENSISVETMTNVVSILLSVWFQHTNNSELIQLMVEIFHLIAALPNNHIAHWAAQAYHALLRFIQSPSQGSTSQNSLQRKEDSASSSFGKTATIGLLSITLRSLSPGPFAASTTANLDPAQQQNVALIGSLQQLHEVITTTPTTFQPLQVSTIIPIDEVIHNLLPTIVQLGLTCNDQTLSSGCCIFSATILAIYSPYLLPIYTTQPHHPTLFPMLQQLALLMFKIESNTTYPDASDADSQLGCRLVTQLLVTYRGVIGEQAWKDLLNLIIQKLCTTEHFSLRFQCVYILSRVGIHFTLPLLTYLAMECGNITVNKLVKRGETVRCKKTKRLVKQKDQYETITQSVLHCAINAFLRTCDDLPNGYIKRIVLLFLTQTMSDPHAVEILSQLTSVDDEIVSTIQQSADNTVKSQHQPFTRSKGAVIEQYSQCNAVTKILKIICQVGFNSLLLSVQARDDSDLDGLGLFDDSDDSDDDNDDNLEDEEFDLDGKDAISALFGAASDGVRDGSITLDELWGGDDDDDDDDNEDFGGDRQDNPESPYDRFYGVDLGPFVTSFIQTQQVLMNQSQGPFALAKDQLTTKQQEQVVALTDPATFFQQKKQQKILQKEQRRQEKAARQ